MSSYASLNDCAAVSPRAEGSASRSSAALGFDRRAVPRPSSTSRRSWRVSDCKAVSTWSSWTGVDELRRAGRAGLEVDEEVALEEDARADLRGRVLVQRPSRLADLHRHDGVVAAFLRVDALDLADLDACDPHRRVGPQRVRRLEHRLDLVAARERDVLREPEEDEDQ